VGHYPHDDCSVQNKMKIYRLRKSIRASSLAEHFLHKTQDRNTKGRPDGEITPLLFPFSSRTALPLPPTRVSILFLFASIAYKTNPVNRLSEVIWVTRYRKTGKNSKKPEPIWLGIPGFGRVFQLGETPKSALS
jgi:hypothetical protein